MWILNLPGTRHNNAAARDSESAKHDAADNTPEQNWDRASTRPLVRQQDVCEQKTPASRASSVLVCQRRRASAGSVGEFMLASAVR